MSKLQRPLNAFCIKILHFLLGCYSVNVFSAAMLHLNCIFLIALSFPLVLCGRIDVKASEGVKTTTEVNEKPHIELIMENIMPSVDEDHIKVLNMINGSIYDLNKVKGKPELLRTMTQKLHDVNQTDFDENETTTELRPESTSHSHVYERTAHTKTTVHKTKKEKTRVTTTTEMSPNVHLARYKRSFTKEEIESFSEMGKVFSESFKKFNDDATKAQNDFMSFMKKLDEVSAAHDNH